MRGTWQTDDHAAGGGGLVVAAVLALLVIGSGAAAAIATVLTAVLIALAVVIVLAGAVLAAWLVYRARRELRNDAAQTRPTGGGIRYLNYAPERPALEQPSELHLHLHGIDPEQVAEILRRHGRPE